MKSSTSWPAVALVALAAVTSSPAAPAKERDIALSKVPRAVIEAARNAVPGIELTEAEVYNRQGEVRYELEGHAGGKSFELQITTDGKLLRVSEDD